MALLASNSDIDIDLSKLTEAESRAILEVVRRDRELRQQELDYIEQLESEIVLLRQTDHADDPNKCARCGVELWWLFRRGELCGECRDKVCEKCRRPVTKGTKPSNTAIVVFGNGVRNWICVLCSKERELRALTGAWFYQSLKFRRSRRSRRSKRKGNTDVSSDAAPEPREVYFFYDGGRKSSAGGESLVDVDEVDSMYRRNRQTEPDRRQRKTKFEDDDDDEDDNLSAVSEMSEAESLSSLLDFNGATDRTGKTSGDGGVERVNDGDPQLASIVEHNRQLIARTVAKKIVEEIVDMKKDYLEIQLASSGISPDRLKSPKSTTPAADDVVDFDYDEAMSYLNSLDADPFFGGDVDALSSNDLSRDELIEQRQNAEVFAEPETYQTAETPTPAQGRNDSEPNGTIASAKKSMPPRTVSFSDSPSLSPRQAAIIAANEGSDVRLNGLSETDRNIEQQQQQQMNGDSLSNGVHSTSSSEPLTVNGHSSPTSKSPSGECPPFDEQFVNYQKPLGSEFAGNDKLLCAVRDELENDESKPSNRELEDGNRTRDEQLNRNAGQQMGEILAQDSNYFFAGECQTCEDDDQNYSQPSIVAVDLDDDVTTGQQVEITPAITGEERLDAENEMGRDIAERSENIENSFEITSPRNDRRSDSEYSFYYIEWSPVVDDSDQFPFELQNEQNVSLNYTEQNPNKNNGSQANVTIEIANTDLSDENSIEVEDEKVNYASCDEPSSSLIAPARQHDAFTKACSYENIYSEVEMSERLQTAAEAAYITSQQMALDGPAVVSPFDSGGKNSKRTSSHGSVSQEDDTVVENIVVSTSPRIDAYERRQMAARDKKERITLSLTSGDVMFLPVFDDTYLTEPDRAEIEHGNKGNEDRLNADTFVPRDDRSSAYNDDAKVEFKETKHDFDSLLFTTAAVTNKSPRDSADDDDDASSEPRGELVPVVVGNSEESVQPFFDTNVSESVEENVLASYLDNSTISLSDNETVNLENLPEINMHNENWTKSTEGDEDVDEKEEVDEKVVLGNVRAEQPAEFLQAAITDNDSNSIQSTPDVNYNERQIINSGEASGFQLQTDVQSVLENLLANSFENDTTAYVLADENSPKKLAPITETSNPVEPVMAESNHEENHFLGDFHAGERTDDGNYDSDRTLSCHEQSFEEARPDHFDVFTNSHVLSGSSDQTTAEMAGAENSNMELAVNILREMERLTESNFDEQMLSEQMSINSSSSEPALAGNGSTGEVSAANNNNTPKALNHNNGHTDEVDDVFRSKSAHIRNGEERNSMSRSLSQMSSVTSGSQDSIPSTFSGLSQSTGKSVKISGEIRVQIDYNKRLGVLEILILECRDLAPVSKKGCNSFVKVHLLPDSSKTNVRKTEIVKNSVNPTIDETVSFDVDRSDVASRTVWLCVWHKDRFGRNVSLGDVLIPLESQKFGYDDVKPVWYQLQQNKRESWKSKSLSLSLSRSTEIQNSFIELSLKYASPDTSKQESRKSKTPTGELHVVIKRASDLLPVKTSGQLNPFCKIRLLPDKNSQKSVVVKKDCNPTWNQTFVFTNVSLDELASKRRLELTVWDGERLSAGKFLGGLSLGSGVLVEGVAGAGHDADVNVWQTMISKPDEWVDGVFLLRKDKS